MTVRARNGRDRARGACPASPSASWTPWSRTSTFPARRCSCWSRPSRDASACSAPTREAVQRGYRFYSYGDAMLLE